MQQKINVLEDENIKLRQNADFEYAQKNEDNDISKLKINDLTKTNKILQEKYDINLEKLTSENLELVKKYEKALQEIDQLKLKEIDNNGQKKNPVNNHFIDTEENKIKNELVKEYKSYWIDKTLDGKDKEKEKY